MNNNKRKSTNNHNKDSYKKHKRSKNDPKLIQCMSCQQYVKRISQHFVRRKDCLQHYNESNSLYAPQVTKNIDTSTIKKSKKSKSSNTSNKEFQSSVSSFFGNTSINQQISSNTNRKSSLLCQPTNETIDNIDNNNDDFPNVINNYHDENSYTTNQSSTIEDLSSISQSIYSNHKMSQFNPTTLMSIKLYKILSKANTPLYLYDDISDFIKNCVPILKDINKKKIKSRSNLISNLYSVILNGSQIKKQKKSRSCQYMFDLFPKVLKYQISQIPKQIEITIFDIKSTIISLLIDPVVMNESNLLMNERSFINPKNFNHEFYGDIHTGYWFKNAHSFLCKKTNDLLCPLIFFIDVVSLDSMGRQSLEPVTFTLGIFNRKARNSNKFWRLLGYIPNLEKIFNIKYSSTQKKDNLKKIHYQEMLKCILKGLKKLQDDGGFRWKFPNGIEYNLKFPVMYIIGDAQGLDKICNRKVHYSPTKTFMTGCCRDCNSVYKHCHDPEFSCKFHKTSILTKLSSSVQKALSYIPLNINAFAELCFGNDNHGLVGCCPPEPLHQWYLGVVELLINYFWDRITIPGRNYLDIVIHGISKENNRQSDRNMPSITKFQKGLMKDKLTGTERGDQIFMLYISLLPLTVKQNLIRIEQQSNNRYSKNKKNGSQTSSTTSQTKKFSKILNSVPKYNKWVTILEKILSIGEWLSLEEYSKEDLMKNIDVQMKKDIFIFDPDDVKIFESNLDQNNYNEEDDHSNTSLDLSDKCSRDNEDDDDISNQINTDDENHSNTSLDLSDKCSHDDDHVVSNQINTDDENHSNTSLDLSDKCSHDDDDDDSIPNQNHDLSSEEGSIQFINDENSSTSMNVSSIQPNKPTINDVQVKNQSNKKDQIVHITEKNVKVKSHYDNS